MKKFLIKLIPFIIIVGVFCAIPIIVDPFNVFHPYNIRYTGVEPNKEYVKMKYILHEPDKFDAFAFGSSRVGMIHFEKITDVKCYNMAHSGGLPHEDLGNLRTMIKNGIVPKRIYLGVDSMSYTYDPADRLNDPLRVPYEYITEHKLDFVRFYCDPEIVGQAIFDVMIDPPEQVESYNSSFYEYGAYIEYSGKTSLTEDKCSPIFGPYNRIEETISDISEIKALCDENGIEFVVFTNPMYKVTYCNSVEERNYFEFLRRLAEVTPFYNFSSLNKFSLDSGYFYDASHFCTEIGDIMIDCMTKGNISAELLEQGFGLHITAENADEMVGFLEAEYREFIE